jgi:RimJ/RimL family protein N-acetyltransferase
MSIHYRFATLSDSTLVLNWRNDPSVRRNSRNETEIAIDAHNSWFAVRVNNFGTEPIFIFSDEGADIGFTRLDLIDSDKGLFEVSIAVASSMRGKGYGSTMLKMTLEAAQLLPGASEIQATVLTDNFVSLKLFETFGFKIFSSSVDFVNLKLVFSKQVLD